MQAEAAQGGDYHSQADQQAGPGPMQLQKRRGMRRTILGHLGGGAFFRDGYQGRHQEQGGHQHHQNPHGEDQPQLRQAFEAHESQGHKGNHGGHAGVHNPGRGAAQSTG